MKPTFYGVLGVGPDADEAEIRRAYRERVTEVHPDVSDDPDADAAFKRLTEARETLLDRTERTRYDRLGHASYVRRHVTSSVWDDPLSGTEVESPATRGATGDGSTTDDASADAEDSTDAPTGRGESTGMTDGGRTAASRTDGRWRASADRSSSTAGAQSAGATGETATERDERSGESASKDSPGDGSSDPGRPRSRESAGRADRTTAGRADDGPPGGSRTADGGSPAAADGSRSAEGSSRVADGGTRDPPGRSRSAESDTRSTGGDAGYATSTFWASQTPGTRAAVESQTDPPVARLLSALRELGPWVLVHIVFLSAAVGTGLYFVVVGGWELSLPLFFVVVGEVGITVVLSTVHVATRLAR